VGEYVISVCWRVVLSTLLTSARCRGSTIHCVKSRNIGTIWAGRKQHRDVLQMTSGCPEATLSVCLSPSLDGNDVTRCAWTQSKWYAPYGRPTVWPHCRHNIHVPPDLPFAPRAPFCHVQTTNTAENLDWRWLLWPIAAASHVRIFLRSNNANVSLLFGLLMKREKIVHTAVVELHKNITCQPQAHTK